MFESIQVLLDEHTELQEQLADPAVQANQGKARRVGRRYAELTGIVTAYNKYKSLADDLEAAREMASEDPDFAAEIPTLEAELEEAQERLRRLLIPRDPDDGRNVILEVKAGAGGDEAALFAGDLLRMYLRYAEHKGWKTEVISSTSTDVGGYKDAQIAIKGTSNEPAEGEGRINALRCVDSCSIRVLSPSIDPLLIELLGSIASTANRLPFCTISIPKASIRVLLPAPGTPVIPNRIELPE